jgi:prophage regulatory protein
MTHRAGSRVLRIVEVSERVGLCRSSIWRMVKENQFPHPSHLSKRAVGWLDIQIDEWLRTRATMDDQARLKVRRR